MEFKQALTTKNITPGVNKCSHIILHHTGTQEGTIKGVLNTLTTGTVSAHFVIDEFGSMYKIGSPEQIMWHCGVSSWGKLKDMNKYSIGIEVIGPLKNGSFTDLQRRSVKELLLHLMKHYKIPVENVLRHAQIAPGRKTDIAPSFWEPEFKTWEDWKQAKLTECTL